jgi:hypothetical protein
MHFPQLKEQRHNADYLMIRKSAPQMEKNHSHPKRVRVEQTTEMLQKLQAGLVASPQTNSPN